LSSLLLLSFILVALVALSMAVPSPAPSPGGHGFGYGGGHSSIHIHSHTSTGYGTHRSGGGGGGVAIIYLAVACAIFFYVCAAIIGTIAVIALVVLAGWAGYEGVKWIKNKVKEKEYKHKFVKYFKDHMHSIKEKFKKEDKEGTRHAIRECTSVAMRSTARDIAQNEPVGPEAKAKLLTYADSPVTGKNAEKIETLVEEKMKELPIKEGEDFKVEPGQQPPEAEIVDHDAAFERVKAHW
jgi:hypothetical protein